MDKQILKETIEQLFANSKGNPAGERCEHNSIAAGFVLPDAMRPGRTSWLVQIRNREPGISYEFMTISYCY